jgi:predicted PurR-regulated permease PerM
MFMAANYPDPGPHNAPFQMGTSPVVTPQPFSPKAVWIATLGVLAIWLPLLLLHLVPALFAALITYSAARALARALRRWKPNLRHAEGVALAVILLLLTAVIAGAAEWAVQARARGLGMDAVLQHAATTLDKLRTTLPPVIAQHLPESIEALRETVTEWLREHTPQMRTAGGHAALLLGHVLAGMVIGAMLVLQIPPQAPQPAASPLGGNIRQRFDELVESFGAIVFAQLQISAINTTLTAVFLLGVLPLLGAPLPLAGTLVAATFLAGLIPVVGNLISNVLIVTVALSQSLGIAGLALGWLVVIHKLEYFLNAHIIGSRIRSKAWELIVVMVLLEATFGLAGVISAPVIYAQWKSAMQRRGWLS